MTTTGPGRPSKLTAATTAAICDVIATGGTGDLCLLGDRSADCRRFVPAVRQVLVVYVSASTRIT